METREATVRVHEESRPGLMLIAESFALGLVTLFSSHPLQTVGLFTGCRLELRAGVVTIYWRDLQIEE